MITSISNNEATDTKSPKSERKVETLRNKGLVPTHGASMAKHLLPYSLNEMNKFLETRSTYALSERNRNTFLSL